MDQTRKFTDDEIAEYLEMYPPEMKRSTYRTHNVKTGEWRTMHSDDGSIVIPSIQEYFDGGGEHTHKPWLSGVFSYTGVIWGGDSDYVVSMDRPLGCPPCHRIMKSRLTEAQYSEWRAGRPTWSWRGAL